KLVTANGFAVLSQGANPDTPPEQRQIVLGQGPVEFAQNGTVLQNRNPIAQIAVTEFHEPQWLEQSGNSYFRNTNPDNRMAASTDSQLRQGFLEGSNVNAVQEMTRLIEATRAYESHMQAIRTYQQIDAKS